MIFPSILANWKCVIGNENDIYVLCKSLQPNTTKRWCC